MILTRCGVAQETIKPFTCVSHLSPGQADGDKKLLPSDGFLDKLL